MILCHGRWITAEHLPAELVAAVQGGEEGGAARGVEVTPRRGIGIAGDAGEEIPAGDALARAEAAVILEVLVRHGGSRRQTAAELGIHPTTLWRRMKKLGMRVPRRAAVTRSWLAEADELRRRLALHPANERFLRRGKAQGRP
jgi:DNA-binding NtrC family response regulator